MNAAAALAMSVVLIPAVASAESPEDTPLEVRAASPNGTRGLVHHTALTVPRGTVDVSARGAIPFGGLVALAAGVGARTELSAEAGTVRDLEDTAAVVGAGFKQVIARARTVQLSLGGSIRHLRDGGAEMSLGQLGGTVTMCTDAACTMMMSLGLSGLYVREEDDVRLVMTFGFSAGARYMRFLAEVVVVAGTEMLLGGLRFGNARYACDLGVAGSISDDRGPMPFAGLSVRM